MNAVLIERPERLPLSVACAALGMNRSSVYARRRHDPCRTPQRSRRNSLQPRALGPAERQEVLQTLCSDRFADQPPAEVYHRLLQEETYLCSTSTMHRLLRASEQSGERRNQRPAQHNAIPRLKAARPNEVWCWDITKLATVDRTRYLSLYVVLDLFSRFPVAWMISYKENSALAKQLMTEAMARYNIERGELTIHQDRGSPMIAHSYLDLMGDMGATCSHSRPRVSNDNAVSESQFKTQKGQPDYPGRFNGIDHGRTWCTEYFDWYARIHHHSGLAGFTPEQVYSGTYIQVAAIKQQALDRRFASYPERFVNGRPRVAMPPAVVTINPLTELDIENGVSPLVNFPTLTAAGAQKSTLTPK